MNCERQHRSEASETIPPGTRLILVGDPSKLPPIGPGLVPQHVLAAHHTVPKNMIENTNFYSRYYFCIA